MVNIFLATLGQRPEAITVALDALLLRYEFEEAVILHTDLAHPQSGVADAWHVLFKEMQRHYTDLPVRGYEVTGSGGRPILDIDTRVTAEDYYGGMMQALADYARHGYTLHLLVAGGRKAMSVYATLAAAALFKPSDQLWTVLSPTGMLREPRPFHAPPELAHEVTLLNMPIFERPTMTETNRKSVYDEPLSYLKGRATQRTRLLDDLSEAQLALAETLAQHPHASNSHLAEITGKSQRTVENQLREIYKKMDKHIAGIPEKRLYLRQFLIDVMLERF